MKALALVAVPFLAVAGISLKLIGYALKLAQGMLDAIRDAFWVIVNRTHKHL